MHKKKIPMRMCIGCSEMKPKAELIRIVRSPEGEITVNAQKAAGRGAYVCKNNECLSKAIASKRLERTFSCKIENEVYDSLKKEIENIEQ